MDIKELDIKVLHIFKRLKEDEHTNLSKIMKKIFRDGGGKEYKKVLRSVNKLSKYGFIEISGDEFKVYALIDDKVDFIKMKCPDGKIVDSLFLKINEKWKGNEL